GVSPAITWECAMMHLRLSEVVAKLGDARLVQSPSPRPSDLTLTQKWWRSRDMAFTISGRAGAARLGGTHWQPEGLSLVGGARAFSGKVDTGFRRKCDQYRSQSAFTNEPNFPIPE